MRLVVLPPILKAFILVIFKFSIWANHFVTVPRVATGEKKSVRRHIAIWAETT